jgi:hypothetical protein
VWYNTSPGPGTQYNAPRPHHTRPERQHEPAGDTATGGEAGTPLHPVAALLLGAALGAAAAVAAERRLLEKERRRLEEEHRRKLEESTKKAAGRLAALAEYLRSRGCYDTLDRVLVEAEALARRADPEEIAYYQCVIRCLRGRCRVEDCLREMGFPQRQPSAGGEGRGS